MDNYNNQKLIVKIVRISNIGNYIYIKCNRKFNKKTKAIKKFIQINLQKSFITRRNKNGNGKRLFYSFKPMYKDKQIF
jgi:hypothetical protein